MPPRVSISYDAVWVEIPEKRCLPGRDSEETRHLTRGHMWVVERYEPTVQGQHEREPRLFPELALHIAGSSYKAASRTSSAVRIGVRTNEHHRAMKDATDLVIGSGRVVQNHIATLLHVDARNRQSMIVGQVAGRI